jgi:hypothetical protein
MKHAEAGASGSGLIVATLYYTRPGGLIAFSALFDQSIRGRFEHALTRAIRIVRALSQE